jgi:hypothetical protein
MRGQALVWTALLLPPVILGLVLMVDLSLTADRLRRAALAADLAAHAGTQAVQVDPRGRVHIDPPTAEAAVRRVWAANRPAPADAFNLEEVRCADAVGPRLRPGCQLRVGVRSAGFFRPIRLEVQAAAYLLSGILAEDR